jgi:hypothetical protein
VLVVVLVWVYSLVLVREQAEHNSALVLEQEVVCKLFFLVPGQNMPALEAHAEVGEYALHELEETHLTGRSKRGAHGGAMEHT